MRWLRYSHECRFGDCVIEWEEYYSVSIIRRASSEIVNANNELDR